MKVKIYGFTWEAKPANNIESFLNFLKSENKVQIKSLNKLLDGEIVENTGRDYHRTVAATPLDDNLWGGFILTVKNARKFIQSSRTKNGFKISTAQINNESEKFAEINFFIFNSKNGAGLYQYYHNSARLTTLNGTFIKKYREYASINNIKKAKLVTTSHLSPQDFKDRVSELRAIHNIEYELSTIAIPDADVVPASDFVARQRLKVFYDIKLQASLQLKDKINSFLDKNLDRIKRLFLKGKDTEGQSINYSIADDPSIFNEYEFDDFAVELDVYEDAELSLKECDNVISLVSLSNQLSVKDFFHKPVQ
jgi:hypothetical protein